MPRRTLEQLLAREGALPARPEIVASVLELSARKDVSMVQLARLIAQDPVIAARVLRVANSSLYGFPYRVASIDHAVVLLGMSNVRDLVVASVIVHRFGAAEAGLDLRDFWRHSLAVGLLSRIVARNANGLKPEQQFLHGMLHDVGKLLLVAEFASEYRRVIEAVEQGANEEEAERDELGLTHSELGAALFVHWGLPESYALTARFHHDPSEAPPEDFVAVAATHVADVLARAALVGDERWVGRVPRVFPPALDVLGLEPEMFPAIVAEAHQALADSSASLGLEPAREAAAWAAARSETMDILTFLGVIVGVGAIIGGQALEGGHLSSIVQPTAAIIVLGGTAGAVFVNFPLNVVKRSVGMLKHAFVDHGEDPHELVDKFVDFARRARADGILALEADAANAHNPFLKRAISLAVDGTAPAVVRATLEGQLDAEGTQAHQAAKVWENAGAYAPTIGVLGAVLGLIHVMENLSNPDALGPGIAVAFVATVYGVASANMMFLPLGGKLKLKHEQEAALSRIIVEGIASIQGGLPPSLVEEKLRGLAGHRPGGEKPKED